VWRCSSPAPLPGTSPGRPSSWTAASRSPELRGRSYGGGLLRPVPCPPSAAAGARPR
jgi:hypothetical protein